MKFINVTNMYLFNIKRTLKHEGIFHSPLGSLIIPLLYSIHSNQVQIVICANETMMTLCAFKQPLRQKIVTALTKEVAAMFLQLPGSGTSLTLPSVSPRSLQQWTVARIKTHRNTAGLEGCKKKMERKRERERKWKGDPAKSFICLFNDLHPNRMTLTEKLMRVPVKCVGAPDPHTEGDDRG